MKRFFPPDPVLLFAAAAASGMAVVTLAWPWSLVLAGLGLAGFATLWRQAEADRAARELDESQKRLASAHRDLVKAWQQGGAL